MTKKKEKTIESPESPYNGWLVSNSFWKRSFAVLGHSLFAESLLLIIFIVIFMILGAG